MRAITLVLGLAIFGAAFTVSANPKNPVIAVTAETIQGTLSIVDRDAGVIYVKSGEGITYDFRILPGTKISQGGRKLKIDDLNEQIGKNVEVVFRPLHTGNMANSVELK